MYFAQDVCKGYAKTRKKYKGALSTCPWDFFSIENCGFKIKVMLLDAPEK